MDTQNETFCFPMKNLENDIVKLVPFKATLHATTYFEATHPHPELYRYMNIGPFETLSEFLDTLAGLQSPANRICLAIIDKRTPPSAINADGELAGLVACTDASVDHMIVDISHTVIFPRFHRKGISTNVSGLLLGHFLASPADGGLGLLRVQALVSTGNRASVGFLMRLGYRKEGVLRWHRVFHNASQRRKIGNGRAMPEYADQSGVGRDTVYLGFSWEDWRDGGREKVENLIGPVTKRSLICSKL